MTSPRHIGLFGGTFDPVHEGHLHTAALARKAFALDEVRFIPCRISPHKLDTPPTPGEDRLRMLEIATRDLPWATVDDFELNHPGPSYSWQTAEEMKSRDPAARLFWIMGGDQWEALPRWSRPETLADLVEFIVVSRGEDIPTPRPGYRLHPIRADHPATSGAIRAAIAGNSPADWLHPDVHDWIRTRSLYTD